jgi:hypothetical protein
MTDRGKLDNEVKAIEEGNAWLEDDEVVELEVSRPLDKVIPVRLPSDAWSAMRREASQLGIGPSKLARMWIMEKLRHVAGSKKSS